ncbi:MAG: hypothetical protein K6G03_08785 [Lachnospiraceae bacterium]|nr:hypothetical protein [Lachnospiraceae bacterium]
MSETKKIIKGTKLTPDQIEEVDGGFKQTIPGYSYGETIRCPRCGNAKWNEFYCDGDELDAVQKDLYTCAICGQEFAVASGYGITDIF